MRADNGAMAFLQDDGAARADDAEDVEEGLDLDRYLAMWKESAGDYSDARQASQRDREYYDGDVKGTGEGHWTTTELEQLKTRNQPPSVFNVIQRKVDATVGVELRSRTEPRAYPRTPLDQKSSEVATDSLRYVKEKTRWLGVKSQAFNELLVEGVCAVEVSASPDNVDNIAIDTNDFFFDPRSRKADFSDASYLGTAKWVDQAVAVQSYAAPPPMPQLPAPPIGDPASMPLWQKMASLAKEQYDALVAEAKERKTIIESTVTMAAENMDFQDRPKENFGDRARKRVFIVDMWHRDPVKGWMRCVFTGKGKLFVEPASMIDPADTRNVPREQKRKTHPIVAQSCYVSRGLWRYGIVRNMIPVQDDANKRRSKSLHLLNVKQIKIKQAALATGGQTKEGVRTEAARPDGVFVVNQMDDIDVQHNVDLSQGHAQMYEESMAFLDGAGPNPQLQGIQGQAGSGRAILALQQAGLGQLGPVFERLHDFELRVYRLWWTAIQQYWTAPMYVRVTDDKDAARFAAVNGAPAFDKTGAPVMQPVDDAMDGDGAMGGADDDAGAPQGIPPLQTGSDPETGAPVRQAQGPMLADLDMDIILDVAPEAASLQAEQFETLGRLAQAGMQIPPDVLIESSSLPNKAAVLDRLKSSQEEAGKAGPPPEIQAKLDLMQAQTDKIRSDTDKNVADIALNFAKIEQLIAQTGAAQVDAIIAALEARAAQMQGAPQPTQDTAPNAPTGPAPPGLPIMPPQPAGESGFDPSHMAPPAAGVMGAPLNGATGLPPTLGAGPPPATGVFEDPTTRGNGPPL